MGRPLVIAFVVLLALAALLTWTLPLDAPSLAPAESAATATTAVGAATAASASLASPSTANATMAVEAVTTLDVARTGVADSATQAKLRVRVVDADKQPIEHAEIETFDDSTAGVTHTDADGRATLPGPVRGDARRLFVRADNRHAQAHWQFRQDLTITLHWAGPVHGRVVDRATGAAIPGVAVTRHHNYCKHCEPDRAVADPNGAFELPAVPRDQDCVFVFEADGYARQHERLRIPGKGEPLVHTFSLQRGVVVAGRCVDLATRQSLAGVSVKIGGEGLAETAADGAFRVLVLPEADGTVSLTFEHAGHCRVTSTVRTPQLDPAVEFPLPRSATLTGRVNTPTGAPIAGARVRSFGNESQATVPGMPSHSRAGDETDNTRTVSDGAGAFVLTGLVPGGKYRLRAGHADFDWPRETGPWGVLAECVDGAPPAVIVLVPKPPTKGTGTLVGSFRCNGELRAGRLTWECESRQGGSAIDSGGAFRCQQVAVGRVTVLVTPEPFSHSEAPEGVCWRGTVDVVTDADARLDIVHEYAEGTVSGRVTFADGSPAAGRSVWARGDRIRVNAPSGDDGRYELRLPQVTTKLRVGCGGAREVPDVQLGAVGVDFIVPRHGALRVRTRDDAGARVESSYALRRTGNDGFLWLESLPTPDPDGFGTLTLDEGPCTLLLAASGCVTSQHRVEVRATGNNALDVVLARGVPVTVRLHPGATVPAADFDVRVVDAALDDVSPEAIHTLYLPNERRAPLTHAGKTFVGFGPGTHKLVCRDAAIELEPSTFVVGSSPVTVDVKWRKR